MNKVIHIGAPKTASTTIQNHLFMKHPDIHCFGEEGLGCSHELDSHIIHNMETDDDSLYLSHHARSLFQDHIDQSKDKVFIFSDVDIMASPIPTLCANRLHDIIPSAKILILVRNQIDAIASYYMSHGRYLKPAPPSLYKNEITFDDWFEFAKIFENKGPFIYYDYARILDIYSNLFGKSNINIIIYEDINTDIVKFNRDLSKTLGIEIDLSDIFTHTERKGSPLNFKYKLKQLEYIKYRYSKQNNILCEEYGLNLSKYGYPNE